ncbi:synaptotagmin-15-like [Uloborus diversus]|uniref:synaptotagmin-15-like n=1 Tax=Uloborus diversus TaxID=327109 RepID=UPI00240A0051|nr:synaptotagmin-15-like [Uloborus diversus]
MNCLKCCCCCSCWNRSTEKARTLDDASSLILDGHATLGRDQETHGFYVPRRHSSFNTTTTYNPVVNQPGRSHSDSCSSSDDEDTPPPEHRGRCWSTIPATSATDVTSLINARSTGGRTIYSLGNSRSIVSSDPDIAGGKGNFAFDKHVLSEIAESETTEDEKKPEELDIPLKTVDTEIYGYLNFTTDYDEHEQRLTVFLERAEGLPKKGTIEHYSTFVKLNIASSRKNFRLSKSVRNTSNPVYKEEHVFHTNSSKWKSAKDNILRLSVYDSDRQGRYDAIGHAIISLDKLNSEGKERHRLPLTPMALPIQNIGQILIGLFYSATQSRLGLHVIKAKHLRIDFDDHKKHLRPLHRDVFDSFVKMTLMCAGQKVKTIRSRVVVDSGDPFYNHKSNFVVPPQYLTDSSLVVTVMYRGVLGRSFPIGRIALGPYTEMSDGSKTHWGRMAQDSRSVVQWRNLYL